MIKKPERKDQLEIAKKFCLLQPCKILEDIATGRCYACKIGSSIKNVFEQLYKNWEAYHDWDTKTNYIRKDKLLSVVEIMETLEKESKKGYLLYIDHPGVVGWNRRELLAKAIHKEQRRKT